MRALLISDNDDALMGMRLAGVDGVRANTQAEAEACIRKAVAEPDIAILMITSSLIELCHDLVVDRKLNYKRPLLIEIPDRSAASDFITTLERYVSEAMGIRVENTGS